MISSFDTSALNGTLTVTNGLTAGTVANGTTYYIGDVPNYGSGWWTVDPYWHWCSHRCGHIGHSHHEHAYEQVRSAEGGYEARLFCKGCGDTKRIGGRAAKW